MEYLVLMFVMMPSGLGEHPEVNKQMESKDQ